MFILMIVCPPLLVIFIIFMLVAKSSSKIKWLIHNWKSGVMNVIYYVALAMTEAENVNDMSSAKVFYDRIVNFIEFCLELFGEDFYIECAPSPAK